MSAVLYPTSKASLNHLSFNKRMKNSFFFLLLFFSEFATAQIQQNIHKNTGTVVNAISSIDSIRFTGSSTTMEVVLQNGTVVTHAISDIINVNFSSASMHSCGADSIHNPELSYGSVTDQQGNVYKTVMIGTQEWMAENLNTSIYRNGDPITNMLPSQEWSNTALTQLGTWVSYDNDSLYDCPYGKIYNWYATADPRQVCPAGWHIPTVLEWTTLTDYLGGAAVAGGKMKSTSLNYWLNANQDASNESGFSSLGCGYIYGQLFSFPGYNALYWTSTSYDSYFAYHLSLNCNVGEAYQTWSDKVDGYSIRCVKD
jgi:uncharacterized protein (TIGR02145 family)